MTEGLLVNFPLKCKQQYILLPHGKWRGFPDSKNIALRSLPQFLITVGTAQKWAMEMQFTVRVHHAVQEGWKKMQHISVVVRLVQVTNTEAEVQSCVHSEKLKSSFALRRCQFFSHPVTNALTMQIIIHQQPKIGDSSYKILFLMLGAPRLCCMRWIYGQGTAHCAELSHSEVHQLKDPWNSDRALIKTQISQSVTAVRTGICTQL